MLLTNILNKQNRALLRELVATDFKLRYQGSLLGYMWSLLKPLFLFAILYVVFGKFLRIGAGIDHYPIYLLLGIVLWGFFAEATGQGLSSIVGRGDLIRKINFPKYIIVVSGTISALINLGLNLIVVFFFMAANHVGWSINMLLFPFLVIELYVLALAVSFFLSAAFVKYRDITYIWEVIMQAAFYATPVLYPVSLVIAQSELAAKILMLNPVAQIIQDSRYALVSDQTITTHSLISSMYVSTIPFVLILICIVLATIYFRKSAKYFAENI